MQPLCCHASELQHQGKDAVCSEKFLSSSSGGLGGLFLLLALEKSLVGTNGSSSLANPKICEEECGGLLS